MGNVCRAVAQPMVLCPQSPLIPSSEATWVYANMKFADDVLFFYVAGPLCVAGIITSLLTISIFARDRVTFQSTRIILTLVALLDFVYLCCILFFWVIQRTFPRDSDIYYRITRPAAYAVEFFTSKVVELTRNWLSVLIALERYVFFYNPIKFRVIWSPRNIKCIIACVVITAMIMRIPCIIFGLLYIDPGLGSCPGRIVVLTNVLIDFIMLNSLPLACVVILSSMTRRHVITSMRTMPKEDQDKLRLKTDKIVEVLRTVVLVFSGCTLMSLPSTLMHLYLFFERVEHAWVFIFAQVLKTIATLGSVVKSSSNFYVYVLQSERHRDILASLMPWKCRRESTTEAPSTQQNRG